MKRLRNPPPRPEPLFCLLPPDNDIAPSLPSSTLRAFHEHAGLFHGEWANLLRREKNPRMVIFRPGETLLRRCWERVRKGGSAGCFELRTPLTPVLVPTSATGWFASLCASISSCRSSSSCMSRNRIRALQTGHFCTISHMEPSRCRRNYMGAAVRPLGNGCLIKIVAAGGLHGLPHDLFADCAQEPVGHRLIAAAILRSARTIHCDGWSRTERWLGVGAVETGSRVAIGDTQQKLRHRLLIAAGGYVTRAADGSCWALS